MTSDVRIRCCFCKRERINGVWSTSAVDWSTVQEPVSDTFCNPCFEKHYGPLGEESDND